MISDLPYELIGKATVVVIALALVAIAALGVLAVCYAVWYRGLRYVVNLCWRGYDIHGEHLPKWRRTIAIYAHAAKTFDFETVEQKRGELDKR